MIGTRGVPARYGGFETAVEEIGRRLVDRDHEVVVYCRGAKESAQGTHLGMRLVHLPAARRKTLETLSHTALSALHLSSQPAPVDVAFLFNAANAPFVPLIRARRVPVAVHVDGLEWRRDKWAGAGRRYYRAVEALSVRWADALIADAQGIADYYSDEFGTATELLSYGAPILRPTDPHRLHELGLEPGRFHLVVARFEPENHVAEIVEGYVASDASLPLVVVGAAPYADAYTRHIASMAEGHPDVRLLGSVWDQDQLDELYANSLTYLHGHSVGGTNPSLLRAMGASAAVLAWDVVFNREVLGDHGRFFSTPQRLAALLHDAETAPNDEQKRGRLLQERASATYDWDEVAAGYEAVARRLADGHSNRGRASGRRLSVERWT